MQNQSKVLCVYAGKYAETGHLKTHGVYKVLDSYSDHGRDYLVVIDETGAQRTYIAKRFVEWNNG